MEQMEGGGKRDDVIKRWVGRWWVEGSVGKEENRHCVVGCDNMDLCCCLEQNCWFRK